MKKLILFVFPGMLYIVSVCAATRASVHGHPLYLINLTVFAAAALLPSIGIFFMPKSHGPFYMKTVRRYFTFSIISMAAAIFTLPLVNHFIDPSLVSNRSYGQIFWNIMLLGAGYYLWKFILGKSGIRPGAVQQ